MISFRVWAPSANQVQLKINGDLYRMTPADSGWWRAEVATRQNKYRLWVCS